MPRQAALHDGVDIVLVHFVVPDQVLEAEMGLARREVRRQQGQEDLHAFVDALVRFFRLQVSEGALCFLAEKSKLLFHGHCL